MARYIDADALYEKLNPLDLVDKRLYTINAKAVADAIAKTPTADVAPKSEVERLYYNLQAVLEERAETKREIAREIFEKIEKALNLSKCYGESGIYFEHDIETDIAELKKKYTESKQ